MEILGRERRRRWSAAEKLAMVRESLESGQSVSVVARRNGVNPNQLFHWRKLYQDGSLSAVSGDFAGAAVMAALRYGVARGIFSNEAGLGTAGIAQAADTTTSSVRSGLLGMLGTFIDTLVVCTLTGLAILYSGVRTSGKSGAALSAAAFESAMPGFGGAILSLALEVFAYTTILGWSFYGEKCWEFLLGIRAILPFRLVWVAAIPFGSIAQLDFAWLVADILNGLMAIPNLIALLLLSPVVLKLTREYFAGQ
ncbi:alanine:cation symporter family protein [Azotobacter armeniacus]